jgi:hypothetical protein
MTWLRSNWLKGLVLPILLALLRACWVWLWLELIRVGLLPSLDAPLVPLPALSLFYLLSLLAARYLLSDFIPLDVARYWEAALGIGAVVLLIWWRFYGGLYAPWQLQWLRDLGQSLVSWENELPGVVILVPVLIYVWLRGVLDGRATLYRDDVWNAFSVGFAAIALAGVMSGAGQRGLPAGAYLAVFLFFGSGLAAVALASLESVNATALRRGDDRLRFDRYWLISVGSIIAVLLLAGFVLSALISPQSVAQMLRWTTVILDTLGLILYYVLLVLAYIVFFFLGPLLNWLQSMLDNGEGERPEPVQMPDFQEQFENAPKGQAALPPAIAQVLPWLGLAALIFIVGLVFALALRRFYGAKDDESNETRESILSRSLLQEQLSALVRRFGRGRARLGHPFFSLDGEQEARRIVRAAYQELLAAAKTVGKAHRRDQTPTEFREAVAHAYPQEAQSLQELTAVYLKARYAAQLPSAGEASAARHAWQAVQQALAPGEVEQPPESEVKT